MTQLEENYFEAAIEFFCGKQDMMQELTSLAARVEELEKFKTSIEGLPYYKEWVAAYNCDGRHE